MERLQKIIAQSGYCSRRKAEELISSGKVFVNGEKITELGFKANTKDAITVNGTALSTENKEYYLLYKPRSVVSTSKDEKGRKTVVDLIETKARIYPVGRLDYDTTGIILLTNDGILANALMHPKSNINKKYIAKVGGFVTKEQLKSLAFGVIIDGKKTAKAETRLKKYNKESNSSIVEITIHEGRNHQVKKMFEAVGLRVEKLKRETYSFLTLDGLTSGEYRILNPKEVKKLYNEVKKDL